MHAMNRVIVRKKKKKKKDGMNFKCSFGAPFYLLFVRSYDAFDTYLRSTNYSLTQDERVHVDEISYTSDRRFPRSI